MGHPQVGSSAAIIQPCVTLPAMDTNLPIATNQCCNCHEEPEQGGIFRCSACKNQFYCVSGLGDLMPMIGYDIRVLLIVSAYQSKACQKRDWPTHKFNCSLLPPDGLSPAQFEDDEREELRAEADRVASLLKQWMKAYEACEGQSAKEKNENGGCLPEARAIAGLTFSWQKCSVE